MNFYDILLGRQLCCDKTEYETLVVTENGEYNAPQGKAWNKVVVEMSGGEGDFSTAEVTLVVTGGSGTSHLEVNCLDSDTGELCGMWQSTEGYFYEMIGDNVSHGTTDTYTFLIANGKHIIGYPESGDGTIVVSGDATVDADYNIIISGDCSITVTGSN